MKLKVKTKNKSFKHFNADQAISNNNDSPIKRVNMNQEHSFLGGGSIQELDDSESSSSYVSSALHSSAASISENENMVKGLSKKTLRVSQFAKQGT
jgi:hypothetical protein